MQLEQKLKEFYKNLEKVIEEKAIEIFIPIINFLKNNIYTIYTILLILALISAIILTIITIIEKRKDKEKWQ